MLARHGAPWAPSGTDDEEAKQAQALSALRAYERIHGASLPRQGPGEPAPLQVPFCRISGSPAALRGLEPRDRSSAVQHFRSA